jgi:ATPase subunit of ABC transporter with duplicated ATPase domains
MRPDDRVALTGPNGMGKTTLVRLIVNSLNVPPDKVTYVPQEIDLRNSTELLRQVRSLNDETLGRVMAVVSCLNSRPHRLLETDEPSPGEVRKLLLALGIAHAPHFVLMDEPTNHLDLPSVECLEEALVDCPCALFLVSHDNRFLNCLTRSRWRVTPDEKGAQLLSEH